MSNETLNQSLWKRFFSFNRDLSKSISSIPTRLYACPALSKRWHVRASQYLPWFAWPWLLPEGQVPALPKLHVPPGTASIPQLHQAVDNGRWISSTELLRLRIHSSPTGPVAFHITNPLFSAKTWARGREKSWAFWLLSFLKSSGTMRLTSFESVTPDFFFLLLSIFMFLSSRS